MELVFSLRNNFPWRRVSLTTFLRAPVLWRKVVLGKKVTLPAESTLAIVTGKNLTPLPELRARQQRSRLLWLSRLDQAEPARRANVFIWRKRRVTLPPKKGNSFWPSQCFVSDVNGLPSFVRKCGRSGNHWIFPIFRKRIPRPGSEGLLTWAVITNGDLLSVLI